MSSPQTKKYSHPDYAELLTYDEFKKIANRDVKLMTLVALILLGTPLFFYLISHLLSPNGGEEELFIAGLVALFLPFVIWKPYVRWIGFMIFARKPK